MSRFLVRLLTRFGILDRVNISVSHTRKGNRVVAPIIRSLGKENLYLSEMWMCDIIEKLMSTKQGLFIDIGVNIAQTLLKLKMVNRSSEYIGFDPNPVCIFYAQEVVRVNHFEKCQLIPVGISDENKILRLFFYAEGDSDPSASFIQNFRPTGTVREDFVACFNYSQVGEIIGSRGVSIVKIDVEGAELFVLKGIEELLTKERPFVIVEILPVYDARNADRLKNQEAIEALIGKINYRLFRIKKIRSQTKFVLLDTIGIHASIEDSDYLLCPEERVDQLTISNQEP